MIYSVVFYKLLKGRGGRILRRKDRQVTNQDEIIDIIKRCDVCRLALNTDTFPYIVPLNFGFTVDNCGTITLYFHGAKQGEKHILIQKDNRAAFEMDCSHRLIPQTNGNSCSCTMNYESVVGTGKIEYVADNEKEKALAVLMNHYHTEQKYSFNKNMVDNTAVFKLTVQHITAKRRDGLA